MNKITVELTEDLISAEMEQNECNRIRAIDYLLERIGENIYEYSYDIDYKIVEPPNEECKESITIGDIKAWYC